MRRRPAALAALVLAAVPSGCARNNRGVAVDAPGTSVRVGPAGVEVRAPGTDVQTGTGGVDVRTPGADVQTR
jgi:hypothetical protein